ncbi:MAG: tripartite tricarboxylate transporter substrate binding protein, partial [Burkholderiales bacterium]|nr:tripartite tricarboxylate transporter substrate binding protein [Burkholderiales bacterium]
MEIELKRRGARHERLAAAGMAAIAATILAALPAPASAQNYPVRPVRLIVPFAPGAASDITGRLVAQKLGEGFNQSFVVDNRPGAGGNIGHDMAAKAPPDGYT